MSFDFLRDGGEMGALMRQHDWSRSSLGPPQNWPQALRTAVRIMLNTQHPMYIWWGDDCACLYNDAYRLTLGSERHPGSLGLPAREVWAEIWDLIGPQIEHVRSGLGATWNEDRLVPVTRHGRREDVYWTYGYSPIDDAGAPNGIGGILVVCSETTAKVLAENRLRQEIERQRRLFQCAPGFIAVLRGPQHIFEFVNDAYIRLLGPRDFIGKSVRDIVPEGAGQGFFELLDSVYATGQRFVAVQTPIEVARTVGGPHERRYLDFIYEPIVDDAGQISGIFVEGFDVTERSDAQAELRELNATLEARIEAALTRQAQVEEALRQSQKMEAIGQLTGGVAHDFNNLLAAMSGSIEILQTHLAQGRYDGAERYITSAQTSIARAAALTQRLLAFSRRQTLAPKPVDINKLVNGMAELIRRSVGPSVIVKLKETKDVWQVCVDVSQLENALLNLCINARDAMPDGGHLTIETTNVYLDEEAARERQLPVGEYVALCVTDTGTGMTPDVVAHAFDPFFTTKPLGHGTGLGLSMIYGFARQSGGQIKIDSEPGKGTTMCVEFPRYTGSIPDEESVRSDEQTSTGNGETVLVVDDEATLRMVICEVLTEAGYRAIPATDGAAATRVLQSSARIDLLLTDVGLTGGMNGRQVADIARSLRPKINVLFITGYAENAIVSSEHMDAGMQILVKPFAIAALMTKVKQMIEARD
jgi:signal transduction histidine kinase/ActR/RegA family two-component response regulator